MTVRDYYCDAHVTGTGSGTILDPWKTLAAAAAGATINSGDLIRLHLKSGSIFREIVPAALCTATSVALHMDTYGGSAAATIDATTDAAGWVYNATYDLYTATLGTNTGNDVASRYTIGALLEDGVCLPMQAYNSNLTTLRTTIGDDGGYAYNWLDGVVYMVPTDGNPHTYRAATLDYVMYIDRTGPFSIGTAADYYKINKKFENIVFMGGKRHGIAFTSNKNLWSYCGFFACGGQQVGTSGSTHLGNGLEGSTTARVWTADHCWADQIFDTGFAAQCYGVSQTIEEILLTNNTCTANGLSGIDCSTQGGDATAVVQKVTIRGNTISDSLDSFAPAIYAGRYAGISLVHNGSGTIPLDSVNIEGNTISNMGGAGIYSTWCATKLYIQDNTISECVGSGVSHGVGAASSGNCTIRRNTISECDAGLRTNHGHITNSTILTDNIVNDCVTAAYYDTSTTNTPVVLTTNVLNSTTPVAGSRTTGITTGGGNTTTGTPSGTYAYLFA